MENPRLVEVGARLEKIVSESCYPHHPPAPEGLYQQYEQVAIQILDSEFCDFEMDELQDYLEGFLSRKRHELGLPDF